MRADPANRQLLFGVAVALLVLAALAISRASDHPAVTPHPTPTAASEFRPLINPPRIEVSTHLRSRAHLFLAAFLRYEVGDLGSGVARRLRRTAAPHFAAQLLAKPPRGDPPARVARIAHLQIAPLSRSPGRALVSGSARRGAAIEQFSLLFESRRGHWLAVGPGE